jgi:chromosome segregation ATPase
MFRQKYSFMVALQAQHSKYAPNLIRSVVKSIRSDTTDGDNGTTEPARELLERLFVRTQSLDSSASHDSELSLSIEVLKSEFEGALSILRKKERDIRDAEKRVSDDRVRLSQTKQDLDQREKEISKAHVRQQGIEKALKKASKNLALRVKQINNLKLLVEEQDKKIASSQSLLSQKVVEVESLKQDMFKKNEEANLLRSEIKSKEQLLLATNQAVVQQEATVRELRSEIKRKTMDITRSNELRKANEEKLNVAEQELEKQNLGWLAAQQELKELAQLASKDTDDLKGTITDFKRVRSLLDSVRAELISSKEAFASSRRQIEDQAVQLQKQVQELKDQRVLLMSYTRDLEAAQLEIQGKTKELNNAHSRCHELESQLIQEMEKVESLETELTKEKESLEQKTEEVDFLQKELVHKENECSKSQELVKRKESELLEARHEVQDMKLKVESIQSAVQEKDSELSYTQSRLTEVSSEVIDLQQLLNSKDDQLVQVRSELHDKGQHIKTMESELDSIRFRCTQAESVVQRMAELTGDLASSVKVGEMDIYALLDDEISSTGTALESNMHKHNQLEADIEMLIDAKDQGLKAALRKWDVKGVELDELEELPEDPSATIEVTGLSSDTTVGSVVGEMDLQKLQIEAAEAEALAATAALKKFADMTTKSFKRGKADSDIDSVASESANIGKYDSKMEVEKRTDVILEAEKEIVRLFSLTKQLVTDDVIYDVEEQ